MQFNEWVDKHNITPEVLADLQQVFSYDITVGGTGSEAQVQRDVRLAACVHGSVLMRNNSGVAREDGRVVRYGLGNESTKLNKIFKSSDIIGITPVTVTSGDVGKTHGIFTAVEVKKPGWKYSGAGRHVAQKKFLNTITARGGIATFATSAQDYLNAVSRFML